MKNFFFGCIVLLLSFTSFAQTESAKNKTPYPTRYISQVDQNLSLKLITLAPVYDNLNGVYSKPIQKLLIDLLKSDKDWGYVEHPQLNQKIYIENYDVSPSSVLSILQQVGAQGMLTAFITKGPSGLNLKLKLFTKDGGLLLLEESFQDFTAFEINRVQHEFTKLYQAIKNKLPYRGYILSRRGTEVTINVGEKNGVVTGQDITLAQIIKIQRHPKTKILVGSEKEIIGKVRLTKVEPYLSFGQIVFEKESGVVEAGSKVLPTNHVNYPLTIIDENGEIVGDKLFDSKNYTSSVKDKNINGTEPGEWVPKDPPQFGKVILQGGVTQYDESSRFTSGSTASARNLFSPTINLLGQMWITKNIFIEGETKHAVFSASNDLSGSSPGTLNYWYSFYHISVGYNFLFNDDFWGPKVSAQLGYALHETHVSDSSPTAFTSTKTDGFNFKVSGSFPFTPDYPFEIGAYFHWMLLPKFSESPVSSGSSNVNINSFSFFGSYISSPSLRYRLDLSFGQIQADFSGSGLRIPATRSTTIGINSQTFGIEYLF